MAGVAEAVQEDESGRVLATRRHDHGRAHLVGRSATVRFQTIK